MKINNDNIINILGGNNIDEEQNYGGEEDCAIDKYDFNEMMITAKYIFSLEAGHKVSSTVIKSIVSSTGSLLCDMVKSISTKLLSIPRIQEFEEDILGVFHDFNSIPGFNELLTHQHERMFYWEHLMLIPPEKCLLGSKYVERIGGRGQKLVKKFGYFIPLIKLTQIGKNTTSWTFHIKWPCES